MCIVIDTNIIPAVFKASNDKFKQYECVLDWLLFGKAKLVIGGTKYDLEVKSRIPSLINLMKELAKRGKIHPIDDKLVDDRELENKNLERSNEFDDPHIVALLAVSKATILCSEDKRSFAFVNDRKFYDDPVKIPKIVCCLSHTRSKELLSDNNICPNGEHNKIGRKLAEKIKDMVMNS